MQEQHDQYLVPLVFNNDDFASARKSLIYPRSFVRGCREISSRFARRRGFCPRSRKPRGAWPLGGFRVIDADHFFRVHRLFARELQYLRAAERSSSSVEIAVNSSTQLAVSVLGDPWLIGFGGFIRCPSESAVFWKYKRFSQEVNKERKTNELVQTKFVLHRRVYSSVVDLGNYCERWLKKKSQQFRHPNCISVQNSYRFERDKT